MNKEDFYRSVRSLFEVTDDYELGEKTEFKKLEEWDSLLALEIIAMLDEEYEIELDGNDIRDVNTLEDLYLIVKHKSDEL
ncbi:MAG: acyl carrier protein [Balneolaceae bacterium]|nr:acyl carrier protein [Balneolaceae bacterium]